MTVVENKMILQIQNQLRITVTLYLTAPGAHPMVDGARSIRGLSKVSRNYYCVSGLDGIGKVLARDQFHRG